MQLIGTDEKGHVTEVNFVKYFVQNLPGELEVFELAIELSMGCAEGSKQTRLTDAVSEEVQQGIKAGPVRTQMDGAVSEEVQQGIKPGLVRTQMEVLQYISSAVSSPATSSPSLPPANTAKSPTSASRHKQQPKDKTPSDADKLWRRWVDSG